MSKHSPAPPAPVRGHRVRELVCAYRPLRSRDGRVTDVPTLDLGNARIAASVFTQLLAGEPVEVFGVAYLSTKHRLLAWHVLSRGTRASTLVSMPDVFVSASLTPGTTGVMVVHNHPSGDLAPSADDARLTLRLCAAADVLDLPLLDHVIVGDQQRYFSFHEAGLIGAATMTLQPAASMSRFCGSARPRQGCARCARR
jgi:DNA repair protein RadC